MGIKVSFFRVEPSAFGKKLKLVLKIQDRLLRHFPATARQPTTTQKKLFQRLIFYTYQTLEMH